MNFINSQLTPDALAVVSIRKSHYVLIGCYKLETVFVLFYSLFVLLILFTF